MSDGWYIVHTTTPKSTHSELGRKVLESSIVCSIRVMVGITLYYSRWHVHTRPVHEPPRYKSFLTQFTKDFRENQTLKTSNKEKDFRRKDDIVPLNRDTPTPTWGRFGWMYSGIFKKECHFRQRSRWQILMNTYEVFF